MEQKYLSGSNPQINKKAAKEAAYAAKTAELLEVIKVTPIKNIYITLYQCDGAGCPESEVTIKVTDYLKGNYNYPHWHFEVYRGQPENVEEFEVNQLPSNSIILELYDYIHNDEYNIITIINKLKEMYTEYTPATEETSSVDYMVYYNKKVINNKTGKTFACKRKCIFIKSDLDQIFEYAKNNNWNIEGIPSVIENGKEYAIDNSIAYSLNNGQSWVFDHCLKK